MFAAAMLYSAPSVEISIYSTCKRISQKLLRNVVKFINEMCNNNLEENGFRVIRQNMEEIVLQGTGGFGDQRVVNSYPSKVSQSDIKSNEKVIKSNQKSMLQKLNLRPYSSTQS